MGDPNPDRPRFHLVHDLLRARDYQDRPEFDRLCAWWRPVSAGGAGGAGVCALIGIGGAGKTAIAERFLRRLPEVLPEHPELLKDHTLPVPGRLFVFSFYNVPNPDAFFGELAAWLKNEPYDESAPTPSYQHALGLLEQAGSCLLVLDGLEKVQDDGLRGGVFGRIEDGRLRDLVLRAAGGWLPGAAMIITTRFWLFDPLQQRSRFYLPIAIEQLAPETAVALLRARGVKKGTDGALERIARDQGLHAQSVDLMGGYIGYFCKGDPARLGPEPAIGAAPDAGPVRNPLVEAVREQERKFARVAERYRQGLAESDPAALALLQRVCLFRLGVEAETLASIFTGRGKSGISGRHLAGLSPDALQQKLDLLVEMRLLERAGHRPADDAKRQAADGEGRLRYAVHPAVRDGFLASLDADAAQRGHDAAREVLHQALPESLRKDTENLRFARLLGGLGADYPSEPATLDLLEEIVHHTLEAGHAQEAFDIYWDRIGRYQNLGWRLGAYERGERICRAFAGGRPPETAPLPEGLLESAQAAFVNEWALYLKDLGRLDAAARCYERHIQLRTQQENSADALRGNLNLAGVLLLAGHLTASLRAAEEALRLAERADNADDRYVSRAYRGHARGLRGETKAALADFDDALYWQHRHEGKTDWPLYSLGGVWRALLLACLGRNEKATRLTETNKRILREGWGVEHHDIPKGCMTVVARPWRPI